VVTDAAQVERLSKDYYWYSPVLTRQLDDKKADAIVLPESADEVETILRFAYRNEIPVTVRGSGTGNYGQCIPLYGGIVLDFSLMSRILEITPEGVCRAEPGTRLVTIEEAARKVGWELRCYPSTFVKASLGGFLCGGSGGIGSITYGGLRDNDNVRSLEIMTMEENPRRILLKGDDIFRALHAWGTTGPVISAEIALGPKVPWGQIAACFPTFDACLDYTERFAAESPWRKRLVTCFENPIPSYFKPIRKYVVEGQALVLLELENDGIEATAAEIEAAGGKVTFRQPWSDPRPGPLLSDYTWNHTTLWAKKADETLTYLQSGFDLGRLREQLAILKEAFGDEHLSHFEFVRGGDGKLVPAALPIIRFTTEERLYEIINLCRKIGVGVADPHLFRIEHGGRMRDIESKVAAKLEFDPKGLLNPGKIEGHPLPATLTPAVA
jgi:FAD/FMN-containing dehydrogenase